MDEHRVLALKWRPRRLDDIVGQPHVVRTLKNALSSGKVAHAYLFAGPRGVGKTTTARILARAVNCEKGVGPEPCGECPTCRDILAGRALDVIEIDAASTGKVDDVRDLREVVRLAPARARKKVFIIDEAHALTAGASNALLKTLEEPPAHIMFILATTEASELIPTILSRCQRFDFHPLGPAMVIAHLKRIAEAEGIKVDDDALALIAKASRGAMRDAQTLLEQASAFVAERVTAPEIRSLLGLVEREWVERFISVLKERDVKGAMSLLDDLIEAGREPRELLEEIQEELRDALMLKLGAETAPLGSESFLATPERRDWFGEEELLTLLGHIRRAVEELSWRSVAHPRVAAEVAVARLMRRERALSWKEIEEQMAKLEGIAGGTATVPPSGQVTAAKPDPVSVPLTPRPAAAPPIPLADIQKRWPELLEKVRVYSPGTHAYIQSAKPVALEGGTLVLEVPNGFQREGLKGGDAKAKLEAALETALGARISVAVSEGKGGNGNPPPPARTEPAPGQARPAASGQPAYARHPAGTPSVNPAAPLPAAAPDWVEDEPLVKSALKVFKARLIEAKRPPGPR